LLSLDTATLQCLVCAFEHARCLPAAFLACSFVL
jgi:hypothetical protein